MSKFSETLQSSLEEAWQKNIKATALWNSAIDSSLQVEHYASLLRETYHYTKQSALIQATAIPHFQTKFRDLVKPFLNHANEEEWHFKLCAKDLENLGYSAEELASSNPLPTTEGYIGFAINRIHYVNPLSYLGYLYNLEYMAIKLGPEFIDLVRKKLNLEKNQLSFFLVHAEEDKDHIAELAELVDKFVTDPSDKKEVLYTANTAAALYAVMVDAAFNNPWNKEARNVKS